MANQMIALQSRNPQLPDPARATAQYANMMNMASQQRASQLQAERIRQEMEFAKAKEGREVDMQSLDIRGKQLDNEGKEMARLYKMGAAILETEDPNAREAAYSDLLGLITETSPQMGATIRQVAPTFNPNVLQAVMMETEQYFNKKYATPIASLEIREDGTPVSVQVGGLNPQQRPIYDAPPPMAAAPRATPTAPQAAAPAGPIPTGKFGETRVVPDSARPLTADQQDHIREMQEGLGMSNTPASFSPGASAGQMTPDMVPAILDSAVNTGVMAQIDLDQMLALAPPQARQGIMDVIRSNKIALQADAPSLAASGMGQQQPMAANPVQRPQAQFAVNQGQRPPASFANLGGQPAMQNTMLQSQPRTVSKLQRRDPNVSPLPGSSQVPLPRVAGEAAAEEGGKQGVRLKVEPVIAGETKSAQLRAEKDASFSDAQSQFDAAWSTVNNRLSDIKRFRKHPAATRVIGPLDAFTPNFGRARGAQQIYDTLVASATFDALQEMRVNSPTGGALGNVSDADIRLLKESIGALGQAQNEEDFFESLRIYEERLMQVRDRLEKRYRQSYGYRLGNNWKPPVTTSRPRTPTNAGRKAGAFTVMEVDE